MTARRGENPGSLYEFFEEVSYTHLKKKNDTAEIIVDCHVVSTQKHRKLSGKKKKFFKEEDQFWKPDEEEDKIYDQLSEKQYREILRGQIQ